MSMQKIIISAELKALCPQLRLCCIGADVIVQNSSMELLSEISTQMELIKKSFTIETIRDIPTILASRTAYKSCGKDPARYRLSAEALLRRVVSGKELYYINNVVDQLNLVSITTGFSIGGYDADQIDGSVVFGIGLANEPYSGIGRGELNIEFLPVFRDDVGPFGTPTSDSQRTEVTEKTTNFLMVLIDFGGDVLLEKASCLAGNLLKKYCQTEKLEILMIE